MKIGLATTTINEPVLLKEYADSALEHTKNTGDEIFFIVAGDRRTPKSAETLCSDISVSHGILVEYLTPEAQLKVVKKSMQLGSLLKWDCIQRRNIAGFRALQLGADLIIYIDDDNFIKKGNYFGDHVAAIKREELFAHSSSNGFLNIMETAQGPGISDRTFPRGYPFEKRAGGSTFQKNLDVKPKIASNAGLWLEEADIDAVTRIGTRPVVETYALKENESLCVNTWTPINSQNTSFLAQFMVGYFLSSDVGRYDDIYAGYIFQKLVNHFGFTISFGSPIVIQYRNEHDLLIDLENEISGMRNIDFIIEFIRNLSANGSTPTEYMNSLLDSWESALILLERKHPAAQDLRSLLLGYRIWLEAIATI
jgi:hypothetical protein